MLNLEVESTNDNSFDDNLTNQQDMSVMMFRDGSPILGTRNIFTS
jgi:hypothetical protein